MTAVVASVHEEKRHLRVLSWKTPLVFLIFTVLFALLPVFGPRNAEDGSPLSTTFRFSVGNEAGVIPNLVIPATVTAWIAVALLGIIAVASVLLRMRRKQTPLILVVLYVVVLAVGFLAWAAAGTRDLPVVGLLGGALALATPLIFGSLGGIIGERVGVVNIAIEAQLLAGAFLAALVGSMTGSPWAGLIAAMVAGALVALILAVFAITYFVDQVIVGVVLNVLIAGLTTFLFRQVMNSDTAHLNTPPRFPKFQIPVLGDIPVIGPIFFQQTVVVYIMYIVVFAAWFALYRTRWGLRLRAVGEHPQAADTVGINVNRTRYLNVLLAGAIAGIGGAFYTLVSVPAFNPGMTAGAGFIALAAVIFGKWDPIKATLAALLFGFASNLQGVLGVLGSPVPSQFMLMLPYVVTLFAVAGLVGRSRGPAASGKPYVKS